MKTEAEIQALTDDAELYARALVEEMGVGNGMEIAAVAMVLMWAVERGTANVENLVRCIRRGAAEVRANIESQEKAQRQ